MLTSTNRQLDPDGRFLADNAVTGGIDYDWRLSPMYNVTGLLGRQPRRGNAEAITRLQESNVHAFQRPDADYIELDPTRPR